MRIGAQVSSAGGPDRVFERARSIGAEAIQLFLSAPQQWRHPAFSTTQVEAFVRERETSGLPVFAHAVYLVNLASSDQALVERSIDSLSTTLRWCSQLGVIGAIFHVGSHLGAGFENIKGQVCGALRRVLSDAPGPALLIMENNAGQGGGVGGTFAELGALLRGAGDDPRLGICLDTCHALAMGYDVASSEGCSQAMTEFEREIGLDRLVAVHANDSKVPLGGIRDRHENIGDGHIGLSGFRTILAHPALRNVPFLLEVPGIGGKGPDAENVRRLQTIRDEVAPGPLN